LANCIVELLIEGVYIDTEVIIVPINFNFDVLKEKEYITKKELIHVIKSQTTYVKDSSVRWIIHQLVGNGEITKIDSNHFYNGVLTKYQPSRESNRKNKIKTILNDTYPSLDAIIYETSILNEWVNHQISKNIIIVEVEKYYIENIFNALKKHLGNCVLYNPTFEDYDRYAEHDTVVVTNFITRSPKHQSIYEIKLEKLIVDIFSNDLISEFVNPSEYSAILSLMFSQYKINGETIITYAKRRNLDSIVEKHINEHLPRKRNYT